MGTIITLAVLLAVGIAILKLVVGIRGGLKVARGGLKVAERLADSAERLAEVRERSRRQEADARRSIELKQTREEEDKSRSR
ncbi:MAG: hypothetical protein HZB56_22735 [Deltaproteobacteria bacterium]|nr:hypothetical protein [Deltaproteobacteria bacterium]